MAIDIKTWAELQDSVRQKLQPHVRSCIETKGGRTGVTNHDLGGGYHASTKYEETGVLVWVGKEIIERAGKPDCPCTTVMFIEVKM